MPDRPPRNSLACLGRLLASGLTLLVPASVQAQESLETAVKAAYLYKLVPFVEWPAAGADGSSRPFAICVVGADPFGVVVDRVMAGQRVGARPIVVRRLPAADRNIACEIAYLSGSRGQTVREALRLLRGSPVLTVTDSSAAPGIVDFAIDRGHVQFRVDDETAAESGLIISSKLLKLAISVKLRRGSTDE